MQIRISPVVVFLGLPLLYHLATAQQPWQEMCQSFSLGLHVGNNQTRLSGEPKPPVTFGKIIAEFAAGVGAGIIGNLLFFEDGPLDVLENTRVKGDTGYNPARHWLMSFSSSVTSSVAVYAVGNIGEAQGSYRATALGAFLGIAPVLLLAYDDPYYWVGALTLGVALQSAGSVLGFYASRRYDKPLPETGAFPSFQVTPYGFCLGILITLQ